jgi:hypothetical protein
MRFLSTLSPAADEDPVLLRFRETAEALRLAYRFNREAERYHLGGAPRAAQRQAQLAQAHARTAEGLLRTLDASGSAHTPARGPGLADPVCVA